MLASMEHQPHPVGSFVSGSHQLYISMEQCGHAAPARLLSFIVLRLVIVVGVVHFAVAGRPAPALGWAQLARPRRLVRGLCVPVSVPDNVRPARQPELGLAELRQSHACALPEHPQQNSACTLPRVRPEQSPAMACLRASWTTQVPIGRPLGPIAG